jgi:predicted SAM-dependent methyltransferase
MKRLIQSTLNTFGYEIRKFNRRPNIALYSSLYPQDSIKNKRFYNIGAGAFSHPCWTNVDYDSEWYASNRSKTLTGIQYDLFSLEPLPIDSDSAEVVYSSHTVEHINDEAAQNMFNESFRILKPKGYLRITAPNIDLGYRAYKKNDRHYFYWIDFYSIQKNWRRVKYNKPLNEASIGQIFLEYFATSVSMLHEDGAKERIDDNELNRIFNEMHYEEALNYCCSKCTLKIQKKYPGNHINWWNKEKMVSMLEKAGFTKIYLSSYGQSCCPVLRNVAFFDNTHPKVSLYVETIK